jgi:hypothetical protein
MNSADLVFLSDKANDLLSSAAETVRLTQRITELAATALARGELDAATRESITFRMTQLRGELTEMRQSQGDIDDTMKEDT